MLGAATVEIAPALSAESEAASAAWGVSGSAPQTGLSAYTSGRAFKTPDGEQETASPANAVEEGAPDIPPEDAELAALPPSKILVVIDKAAQEMKVFVDHVERYIWKVSTGTRFYDTPSGAYAARSMNEIWYSRQWDDAPMPHAIFFTRKGHAIHGTAEEQKLGRPASHGCVRLSLDNARTLFALVKETGLEKTEIVLRGELPRPEVTAAARGSQKQQIRPAKKTAKAVVDKKKPRGPKTGIARSGLKKQQAAAKQQPTTKRQPAAKQQTAAKQQAVAGEAVNQQNKKRSRFESGWDPYAIGSPRRLSRREWLRLYYSGEALPPGYPPPRVPPR